MTAAGITQRATLEASPAALPAAIASNELPKAKVLLFVTLSLAMHIAAFHTFTRFTYKQQPIETEIKFLVVKHKWVQPNFPDTSPSKSLGHHRLNVDSQAVNSTNSNTLNLKKYYSTTEVDTRPAPIDEWNLDTSKLKAFKFNGEVAQLTIWVDEQGTIDHIEFLNIERLPQEIQEAISSLHETKMAPATISGIAVRSVMSLELDFGH